VRVYATTDLDRSPTQGYFVQGGVPIQYDAPIDVADFAQIRHTPNLARVHYTDKPAQAMMHAAAVVKYAGTTQGFGGYIGAAYDGWGGYMVELTPREQWVSFAPYYASSHPGGMEHFINVVVDTSHMNDVYLKNGSNFIFQRRMEGTDLIWGSMAVTPGVDHWLEGRNGARFGGFVYGGLARGGHEEYRPGLVRDRDDDHEGARPGSDDRSADGTGSMPLHPSEYEEKLAIAYGYPLAPNRVVVAPGDSLAIRATSDCFGTAVNVESVNDDPVGLRLAALENGVNAKIVSQNPVPLTGAVKAIMFVGPIDRTLDASATLVITDKTGKATRLPFTYASHRLATSESPIDFGVLVQGDEDTLAIVLRNRTTHEIPIADIALRRSIPAFRILWLGAFPLTVGAQDSVVVRVVALANSPKASYNDTLVVSFGCSDYKIPVRAATNEPCLQIHHIDFGAMPVGASNSRTLRIVNAGGGIATFENPSGGDVLEFSRPEYSISAADLAMLADTGLAAGRSVDVTVTFTASAVGEFRDTARLWSSRNYCDTTSVWIARVTEPVSAPIELASTTHLEAISPNPTDGATTIRFTLARRGHATIELYDERGARVATVLDADRGIGTHTVSLDAATLAPGVYHVRLDVDGAVYSRAFVRK